MDEMNTLPSEHATRRSANITDHHGSPEEPADRHYDGMDFSIPHEDPFHSACIPTPPDSLLPDLEDPPGLPNIATLDCVGALDGCSSHEKWTVDKDTLEYLSSIIAVGEQDQRESLMNMRDAISWRDFKLEEPILKSDPDLDLLNLKHRNRVTLDTRAFKPLPLDEESGEGINWSTRELQMHSDAEHATRNDRLEVNQETVAYVMDIAKVAVFDLDTIVNALITDKDRALQPISPPLLPLSPPLRVRDLSLPSGDVDFTSTPEDLIAREAAELEQRILDADSKLADENNPSIGREVPNADKNRNFSLFQTPDLSSSSSRLGKKPMESLKADVPLIPYKEFESDDQLTKTASFSDQLCNTIPAPESIASATDEELERLMTGFIEPNAMSAIHQAANEKLIEIDTTMRVPIPDIENIEPMPPWKSLGCSQSDLASQKLLLSQFRKDLAKNELHWGGISRTEHVLPWSPFPARLAKVEIHENLDDGSLEQYMAEMRFEDDFDFQSFVDQSVELELLENDDGEYDTIEPVVLGGDLVEPAPSETEPRHVPEEECVSQSALQHVSAGSKTNDSQTDRPDMQSLLRKRKLELEAKGLTDGRRANHISKATRLSDATHGGLANFLQIQSRLDDSSTKQFKDNVLDCRPPAPRAVMIAPSVDENDQRAAPGQPLPAPEIINKVNYPVSLVVSSKVLEQRHLIRRIESLLPEIEIIERNPIPHSSKHGENVQRRTSDSEADITISPSTGLITTTLQRLKQEPLPGQTSFFGVRDRIQAIALCYERLLVLVSEGRQPGHDGKSIVNSLDERDAAVLSDTIAFASTLDTDVEVYYVPGVEEDLAKWCAAIISRCAPSGNPTKLMHEETTWERFLRDAGLNTYAAQAVLHGLKLETSDNNAESDISSVTNGSNATPYGLAAFIDMSLEERLQHFGPVLGDERMLRKVSRMTDQPWLSASAV